MKYYFYKKIYAIESKSIVIIDIDHSLVNAMKCIGLTSMRYSLLDE